MPAHQGALLGIPLLRRDIRGQGPRCVLRVRQALASRRMRDFVANLRANPIRQAVPGSRGRDLYLSSANFPNRRFAYRQQPGARPQILVSCRSHAACSPKRSFSGNGEGIVKRAIRAPGGAGRQVICCQTNAAFRSPEQAHVFIDTRQNPPQGCFVSKIVDPHELRFFAVHVQGSPFCRVDMVKIGWRELARSTRRFFL